MIKRSNYRFFSLQKIQPCEIFAGNSVMRNKGTVADQVLHKGFQFDQHFLFGKQSKLSPVCFVKKWCAREEDKIRITEICQDAEIERSTFYYHFKDKYELVAWIFFQDADKTNIIDLHDAAEGMKQMKNEMLFYKRAYEDTSQNALWQYMLEYFTAKYTELAKEMSGDDTLDAQLLFSIRLYCYGAVDMTKEWVLEDNMTSAETIVQMMFSSMPDSLRQLYFRNA